ncbi:TlpA disulfide reductase family protein [Tsuneonella mangrovi]|uniref:TlpA disulfide reductase family protein n=1 Tax=Tsuneonella mangrovi TaxID=1982042 RepID=UPI000BA2388A|nr:TlpA disulfide reductase family protein [Tsuneonella mangrovi]
MPPVVNLGPLALASDRLLAVGLMIAFVAALDWLAGRRSPGGATLTSTLVLLLGVAAARLAYVLGHVGAFAADPASTIALWEGGFAAWAGFLAASAVLAWRLRPARLRFRGLALLALAAALWFVGIALLTPPPKPMPALPALTDVTGKPVSPADLHGKPYVLNLWATWCPPCRRELPMLAAQARDNAVPILLVNEGEDKATAIRFLAQNHVAPDHIVLDSDAGLARSLGASGLPVSLFVDAKGRIAIGHFGQISRAAVEDGIAQIEK